MKKEYDPKQAHTSSIAWIEGAGQDQVLSASLLKPSELSYAEELATVNQISLTTLGDCKESHTPPERLEALVVALAVGRVSLKSRIHRPNWENPTHYEEALKATPPTVHSEATVLVGLSSGNPFDLAAWHTSIAAKRAEEA